MQYLQVNRTEGKPLPFFMNSSNTKYTSMIPPFHNCFQSTMAYIIWQLIIMLWFRQVQSSCYTRKEIVQGVCYFFFISSSSSIRVIFSEKVVLLEKNGLTVFQKDLLSSSLFTFNVRNIRRYLFTEVIHTYFFVSEKKRLF